VPSPALEAWSTSRARRLDQLHDAHAVVAGPARGRKWQTEQINWSLNLKLAAEFQGYCRELHDVVGDLMLTGIPNSTLAAVMRVYFTDNRQLDKGNAQPNSLSSDFARFGLDLWDRLNIRYTRASKWKKALDLLNQGRNAIAHSNEQRIAVVAADGHNVGSVSDFRSCRSKINQLATAMDRVLASHIASTLQSPEPW